MKLLILLFTMTVAAFGQDTIHLDQLLKQRNLSLSQLESLGLKYLSGEVTGVGKSLPFSKVALIITFQEAILIKDIKSLEFQGPSNLNALQSLKTDHQLILAKEIQGYIIKE